MKRVRLTNESLNSYGTWVVTAGIDLTQYQRNPVLLYMHRRGEVIGQLRDIRREGDALTAALDFDEASELSKRCKVQYEKGSLRMVSVGLDILETSQDKQYLKAGQSSPTITKSKLFEVSLVDIGANDDAIVLQREGKVITLGAEGDNPLPLLDTINHLINKESMNKEELALSLGLSKEATEAEINATIAQLKAAQTENEQLKKEKAAILAASIERAVDTAISEKRLSADQKEHFVELGKLVGMENLQKTLAAMSPMTKLSQTLGHQGGAPQQREQATYTKLSEVPVEELEQLKLTDRATYARLFEAEYGIQLADVE